MLPPYERQLAKDLGRKIYNLRKDLGFSLAKLAFQCQVHPGGTNLTRHKLGRIERGKQLVPLDVLQAITAATGVLWSYWELESEVPWQRRRGDLEIRYSRND